MAVEAKRVKRNHRDLWPRPAIHAEPSINTPSASSSSATDRGISSHVDKKETLSWPRAGGSVGSGLWQLANLLGPPTTWMSLPFGACLSKILPTTEVPTSPRAPETIVTM